MPLVCLACVVAASCGSRKRQKRTGDAALVERITAPVLIDGAVVATADEIEPNDTDDIATELLVGHSIHGKIDPESDVDAYRIDIDGPGVLALEVSAVRKTDLVLELHDAGGVVIARSDRGTAATKEGIPNFGVAKGRYTAVIRGKRLLTRRGRPIKPIKPALPYDLSAKLITPPANAEREPDDDRGTANDLIVGDAVTGYIGWSGDEDVWKLSVEALSANNSLDIEVGAVESTTLTLELSNAVGEPLLVRRAPRGAALDVRGLVPNIAPGAAPYQYLTIKGSPSNPESTYTLRVIPKNPEPDAEVEPDDTLEKPMPIPADRTVVIGQWSPGDIDYFAIPTDPAARTLEVSVAPPSGADLGIALYVDGKQVAKSDNRGKGKAEKVSAEVPGGAQAVLRVHGADRGTEGTYEVKVAEGGSAK